MDINYDRYETTISCDDNSCSLRYKLDGGTIAVFRYMYTLNVGRRVKQNIVVLKEQDHEQLFKDIVLHGGFSPELGETILTSIRERNYKLIYDHIQNGGTS